MNLPEGSLVRLMEGQPEAGETGTVRSREHHMTGDDGSDCLNSSGSGRTPSGGNVSTDTEEQQESQDSLKGKERGTYIEKHKREISV